jgi:hypothetical protein
LNGPEFVDNIKILTQLVTPDDTEAKSLLCVHLHGDHLCRTNHPSSSGNLEGYEALIGIGTSVVVVAAGPAVAAIGLSVFFTQWIAKAYDTTCLSTFVLFLSTNACTVRQRSVASWGTSST